MSDFLPIYDLTPFTMLDFPDRIACIIWFAGCNMRCGYCHNPQIVKGKSGKLKSEDILTFLKSRQGLIEGVVLSGGEATLYKGILPFAEEVRQMGFSIKLDTNGTRPETLQKLLDKRLLDYVALDYKAPSGKYAAVTKIRDKSPFDRSLQLLCDQKEVPFEVRTTVHTDLLDEADITEIIHDLEARSFIGSYYIQNYRPPTGGTLGSLASQERLLSQTVPTKNLSFSVKFRNFEA